MDGKRVSYREMNISFFSSADLSKTKLGPPMEMLMGIAGHGATLCLMKGEIRRTQTLYVRDVLASVERTPSRLDAKSQLSGTGAID